MPTTKKNLRGLQNIRTMGRRPEDRAVPHKVYMRLSILEMEKCRRETERARALEKVQVIDQRLLEIDLEMQEIAAELGADGVPIPGPVKAPEAAVPSPETCGTMKIQY